jgi:hypothetical protein
VALLFGSACFESFLNFRHGRIRLERSARPVDWQNVSLGGRGQWAKCLKRLRAARARSARRKWLDALRRRPVLEANDWDPDGGTFSASVVANPTNGTITAFSQRCEVSFQ